MKNAIKNGQPKNWRLSRQKRHIIVKVWRVKMNDDDVHILSTAVLERVSRQAKELLVGTLLVLLMLMMMILTAVEVEVNMSISFSFVKIRIFYFDFGLQVGI